MVDIEIIQDSHLYMLVSFSQWDESGRRVVNAYCKRHIDAWLLLFLLFRFKIQGFFLKNTFFSKVIKIDCSV